SSQTLVITAVGAVTDKNVESLGKQDPYLQFSLDYSDKKSYQKTFVAKKAGKEPSWNQTFNVALSGQQYLFVELMDEESGVDELIGFAAIPIAQVVQAPGAALNGLFDLYNLKGNVAGSLNLILQAQGFNNSSNQQPGAPVRGQSLIEEGHQSRCKSLKNKERASEAGVAVLGGALAIGAGLLGKKLYDDHKKEKEEEEREHEEEERRRQEFSQREEELKRREEDFSRREQQEKDEEERRRRERQEQETSEKSEKSKHKKERRHKKKSGSGSDSDSNSNSDSNSDSDDDCHKKKHGHHHERRDACDWDPVGTYSAGDRVEYKGRTYVCLQGHTSNPTWEPTVAHSLWRTE
ncbi:hypothetical protein BC940DRAFT_215698, partial [Gongronella butleri]